MSDKDALKLELTTKENEVRKLRIEIDQMKRGITSLERDIRQQDSSLSSIRSPDIKIVSLKSFKGLKVGRAKMAAEIKNIKNNMSEKENAIKQLEIAIKRIKYKLEINPDEEKGRLLYFPGVKNED